MAYPTTPKPTNTYVIGTQFKTEITEFDSGKIQKRKKWSTDKKIFQLEYKNITYAETQLLQAYFETMCGQYGSDTFIDEDPGDSSPATYNIRFNQDEIRFEFDADTKSYSTTIELIEEF